MPESKQKEVIDYVEFLKHKTEMEADKTWSELSVSAAIRGMETEESPYSQSDLKEIF